MVDPNEQEKRAQDEAKRRARTISIRRCARCGGEHDLEFTLLKGDPIETVDGTYTHWAMCPETKQPIMLAKDAIILDEGLLDLFKSVARGDLEVERLMSKVMKRRIRSAEIPEEVGDLDNPMKVVGFETMGSRMAFILRTDRDSMKIYVDTKTFNDVLVQSVANGSQDMAELVEQFVAAEEGRPLDPPKSFRRMLHELGGKVKDLENRIESIREPICVGDDSEPARVIDVYDGEKVMTIEVSRRAGDLVILKVDRETLKEYVSLP